jgi:membrane-associated phospholipid phosphatase
VGADLIRAQVLSQGIVQGGKFATRRPRPDASNNHSLPSGHTAAAFATATVLQDHFGWKVGVPAYGFGAYVAASRMSANKHYLSDVLLGAAIGVAAGRTVTIGSGKARFQMGVAPTPGGAAVTFTQR